jgi:hypothetical protein
MFTLFKYLVNLAISAIALKKHKACQKYPCLPIRAIEAICMAEYVMGLSIYLRRIEKYQIHRIFIFG